MLPVQWSQFQFARNWKTHSYTALVFFAIGIVISSFVFNTLQMKRPFSGTPVTFSTYFKGLIRIT
jgi:glucose uptake protein